MGDGCADIGPDSNPSIRVKSKTCLHVCGMFACSPLGVEGRWIPRTHCSARPLLIRWEILSYRNKAEGRKGRHLLSCSGLYTQVHQHTCMKNHTPHTLMPIKQDKTPQRWKGRILLDMFSFFFPETFSWNQRKGYLKICVNKNPPLRACTWPG